MELGGESASMMNPYPVVLALMAIFAAAWLWAEFKAGLALRLVSGVLLITSFAYAAYYIGWLGPQYTITYYESAVRRSTAALKHGRSDLVLEAFEEYSRQPKPHPNTISARLDKAGVHE